MSRSLLSGPAKKAGASAVGRGDLTSEVKHPVVRRLLSRVSCSLRKDLSPDERQRFLQVVMATAVPFTILISHQSSPKGRGRVSDGFVESMLSLSRLQLHLDEHLVLLKYYSALWMQLAVGDVDTSGYGTGHQRIPLPEGSLGVYPVFQGFLRSVVRRWIARALDGSILARSFFASFLLSKRGWPRLCDQTRWETVLSHQTYLRSYPDPLPKSCAEEIRSTAFAVFRNTTLGGISPSVRASFSSTRKEGGAAGEVRKFFSIPEFSQVLEESQRSYDQKGIPFGLRDFQNVSYTYDERIWNKVASSSFRSDDHQTRAQVIDEPGKFRIITAGPGVGYTFLQPLQRSLLRNWKVSRYSTMKDGWEEEVRQWVAPEDWVWNSGDFKAATDQMNSIATGVVEDVIRELYGLYFDFGLVHNVVSYSRKDCEFGGKLLPDQILQMNGQLMGHPLSFPILCVINLAGLMHAIRKAREFGLLTRWEQEKILSMTKVNGDDILFPCPDWFCKMWEDSASTLGLKLSVGKSYASTDFAMINNVMFCKRTNRRFGFLNQALIWNFSLKEGEAKVSPLEVGRAFSTMFEYCPDSLDFLPDCVSHRKELRLMGYQPNFFIPCELGGFGIDLKFSRGRLRATRDQMRVAAACAEGVLNSFLLMNNLPTNKLVREFMKRLPTVRLSTAVSHEWWANSTRFDPFSFSGDVDPTYSELVGILSKLTTDADRQSRRVSLRKLKKIRPMKEAKCFFSRPFSLVPNLGAQIGKPFRGKY